MNLLSETLYKNYKNKDHDNKAVQESINNIFHRSHTEDMEMMIYRMAINPWSATRMEQTKKDKSLNEARKLMESLLSEIIEKELDKDRLREDFITKIVGRINDNQVNKK